MTRKDTEEEEKRNLEERESDESLAQDEIQEDTTSIEDKLKAPEDLTQ